MTEVCFAISVEQQKKGPDVSVQQTTQLSQVTQLKSNIAAKCGAISSTYIFTNKPPTLIIIKYIFRQIYQQTAVSLVNSYTSQVNTKNNSRQPNFHTNSFSFSLFAETPSENHFEMVANPSCELRYTSSVSPPRGVSTQERDKIEHGVLNVVKPHIQGSGVSRL